MTDEVKIEIDGQTIILDVEADLAMGDITEDMNAIAGLIGWYGRVLAYARRLLDDATDNAKYNAGLFLENRIAKDGKEAEWKAKTAYEGSKTFLESRRAISRARELVGRLDAAYDALTVKADILRSKGALLRTELGADEMTTPEKEPPRKRSGRSDSERTEAMRNAMRRKRDEDED